MLGKGNDVHSAAALGGCVGLLGSLQILEILLQNADVVNHGFYKPPLTQPP